MRHEKGESEEILFRSSIQFTCRFGFPPLNQGKLKFKVIREAKKMAKEGKVSSILCPPPAPVVLTPGAWALQMDCFRDQNVKTLSASVTH